MILTRQRVNMANQTNNPLSYLIILTGVSSELDCSPEPERPCSRLFSGSLLLRLQLRSVPAATECQDQLDARRHLLYLQVHCRLLVVQQRGLCNDHVKIAVNP